MKRTCIIFSVAAGVLAAAGIAVFWKRRTRL